MVREDGGPGRAAVDLGIAAFQADSASEKACDETDERDRKLLTRSDQCPGLVWERCSGTGFRAMCELNRWIRGLGCGKSESEYLAAVRGVGDRGVDEEGVIGRDVGGLGLTSRWFNRLSA